ncbi:hypothetical protein LZ32DRAFT_453206 [Colletotrichum eremochloae]|nr:hypothetical protein LZ32DRAFT_453206 [Colletotrichum eremochloae]
MFGCCSLLNLFFFLSLMASHVIDCSSRRGLPPDNRSATPINLVRANLHPFLFWSIGCLHALIDALRRTAPFQASSLNDFSPPHPHTASHVVACFNLFELQPPHPDRPPRYPSAELS